MSIFERDKLGKNLMMLKEADLMEIMLCELEFGVWTQCCLQAS
jgi:hypothetical protein